MIREMGHIMMCHIFALGFRSSGRFLAPIAAKFFTPMPPKPQQQLGEDGWQSFLGRKVLPSEVKKAIEESTHSKRFLAVIDPETGICQMQCRGCKKNLSAANIYQTARSHAETCNQLNMETAEKLIYDKANMRDEEEGC